MLQAPQIHVTQKDIGVSRLELGLTRDKYARVELRSILRTRITRLNWKPTGSYPINLPLQQLVDEFAEKAKDRGVVSGQSI